MTDAYLFWRALILSCMLGMALILAAYSYTHAQQIPWVDQLQNIHGNICCTNNDGKRLDDPDWDTLGVVSKDYNSTSGYRVWEDKEWKEVPNWAVVTMKNQDGIVRVWWSREYQGGDIIKKVLCFLPGTLG